jgi:hypothetical protein
MRYNKKKIRFVVSIKISRLLANHQGNKQNGGRNHGEAD